MNPRLLTFTFILSFALAAPIAKAATVTVAFPSTTSVYEGPDQTGLLGTGGTAQESHHGDGIKQTFTGTGLSSLTDAIFSGLSFTDHTTQGTTTNLDLFINGTEIGNVVFDSFGAGQNINFSPFHAAAASLPIAADPSGAFTLEIVATTDVATSGTSTLPSSGQGSWDFLSGGTVQLIGVEAAVPEPSTWAMMILGFAGIGLLAYRRKSIGLRIA